MDWGLAAFSVSLFTLALTVIALYVVSKHKDK